MDRIISDRAVFDVADGGLILRRIAGDQTIDDIRALTGTGFAVNLG